MYTRCSGCHTVHPLNATLLAQGSGTYRCGKCKKLVNALESLFDEWPDAGQQPVRPGSPPTLGASIEMVKPISADLSPEERALLEDPEDDSGFEVAKRSWVPRILWVSSGVIILAIVSVSLLSFFQSPLIEEPLVRSSLEKIGLENPAAPTNDSGLASIELVSREMRPHPSRPNVLVLDATIINRAEVALPYPEIEVTLLNLNNKVLARHRFLPGEYLSSSAEIRSGMNPETYLPFSLEMLDPGEPAVGFELEFH